MIQELKAQSNDYIKQLEEHSLFTQIDTKEKLAFFMERHVFAVFDFMSLLSALIRTTLHRDTIWLPPNNPIVAKFLNEIMLGEESDTDLKGNTLSHFEMYQNAMKEIGAKTSCIDDFITTFSKTGQLESSTIPTSAKNFIRSTFNLIEEKAPHKLAASFCFGREKSIPLMFQAILKELKVEEKQAPEFYYYLRRHIELDGDSHGPMAKEVLKNLCHDDQSLWTQAIETTRSSLQARINFWDEIQKEMNATF